MRHFILQALETLEKPGEAYDYYICPICGYTHARVAPEKCPVCGCPGKGLKNCLTQ
jgi:rubrerythrin